MEEAGQPKRREQNCGKPHRSRTKIREQGDKQGRDQKVVKIGRNQKCKWGNKWWRQEAKKQMQQNEGVKKGRGRKQWSQNGESYEEVETSPTKEKKK